MKIMFKDIKVDYTKSLETMIEESMCQHSGVKSFIKNFSRSNSGIEVFNIEIKPIENEKITSEIIDLMKNDGLVLAGIEHLIALISQCPNFEIEGYLVALGSCNRNLGVDNYPVLSTDENGFLIQTVFYDEEQKKNFGINKWDSSFSFLGIRE